MKRLHVYSLFMLVYFHHFCFTQPELYFVSFQPMVFASYDIDLLSSTSYIRLSLRFASAVSVEDKGKLSMLDETAVVAGFVVDMLS